MNITNNSKQRIDKDIFTHVMVGHTMDENRFCQDLKYERLVSNTVTVIVTNILNDTNRPRIGSLTHEQAQGFMPIKEDQSLINPHPFDYPIKSS